MSTKDDLVVVMARMPLLCEFGLGVFDGVPRADRPLRLAEDRGALLRSVNRVADTVAWIRKYMKPIATINKRHSSYGLKHLAEDYIGYITNGVFIAAAVLAEYRCEECRPNAFFNMSECAITNAVLGRHAARSKLA